MLDPKDCSQRKQTAISVKLLHVIRVLSKLLALLSSFTTKGDPLNEILYKLVDFCWFHGHLGTIPAHRARITSDPLCTLSMLAGNNAK